MLGIHSVVNIEVGLHFSKPSSVLNQSPWIDSRISPTITMSLYKGLLSQNTYIWMRQNKRDKSSLKFFMKKFADRILGTCHFVWVRPSSIDECRQTICDRCLRMSTGISGACTSSLLWQTGIQSNQSWNVITGAHKEMEGKGRFGIYIYMCM